MSEQWKKEGPHEHLIRPVRDSDERDICTVERACFPDPYPSEFLNYLMKDECRHFFVAVDDGRIVGYTVATAKEKDGHLVSIAVSPDHRRRRIGADLFFAVASALEEEGVEQIHLEVRKGNGAAISFYERMGFRILSEIKHYYSDGEDALVLSRKVSYSPMAC